jgi:hypothetical protein
MILRVPLLLGACLASMLCSACIPIAVSPECRAKMDSCLRTCQSSEGQPADDRLSLGISRPLDTRTSCQEKCHSICSWPSSSEKPGSQPGDTWLPPESQGAPSPTGP